VDNDDDHQIQVDESTIVPRVRDLDTNFVDDDELQAALARSRKAKLHKAKKISPDELAKKSMPQHHSSSLMYPHGFML
jgi:U4/U6.U5 tri-snRNP-associated protein 1